MLTAGIANKSIGHSWTASMISFQESEDYLWSFHCPSIARTASRSLRRCFSWEWTTVWEDSSLFVETARVSAASEKVTYHPALYFMTLETQW